MNSNSVVLLVVLQLIPLAGNVFGWIESQLTQLGDLMRTGVPIIAMAAVVYLGIKHHFAIAKLIIAVVCVGLFLAAFLHMDTIAGWFGSSFTG